jgi:hypothetical protein
MALVLKTQESGTRRENVYGAFARSLEVHPEVFDIVE